MENAVWFARTGARDLSAAARELLARALGLPEPPRVEKDARGKPFLPDFPGIQISISHTRGAVAVALSERPAGVDVEPASRTLHDWVPARFFTGAERSLADCPEEVIAVWTRKEALLKRDGRGITLPLREVETAGRDDLVTRRVGDDVVSFCGEPAAFSLIETTL